MDEDEIGELDPEVRARIEKVRSLHRELERLFTEYADVMSVLDAPVVTEWAIVLYSRCMNHPTSGYVSAVQPIEQPVHQTVGLLHSVIRQHEARQMFGGMA